VKTTIHIYSNGGTLPVAHNFAYNVKKILQENTLYFIIGSLLLLTIALIITIICISKKKKIMCKSKKIRKSRLPDRVSSIYNQNYNEHENSEDEDVEIFSMPPTILSSFRKKNETEKAKH